MPISIRTGSLNEVKDNLIFTVCNCVTMKDSQTVKELFDKYPHADVWKSGKFSQGKLLVIPPVGDTPTIILMFVKQRPGGPFTHNDTAMKRESVFIQLMDRLAEYMKANQINSATYVTYENMNSSGIKFNTINNVANKEGISLTFFTVRN